MIISLRRPLPDGKGHVSQWFGLNPAMYAKLGIAGHDGIDYGVPVGTPVLAMHDGQMQQGWDKGGYGNFVRIVGEDFTSLYAHLSRQSELVEHVKAGDVIGWSGNTGWSTGAHLHVSLKVTGMRNPAYRNWIDFAPFRDAGEPGSHKDLAEGEEGDG